jgi:hypothetical protein
MSRLHAVDRSRMICRPLPRERQNKPRHQDRRWATPWAPEQISHRLKTDVPDDGSTRIPHEAISRALRTQGRRVLKRGLVACLRTRHALRVPQAGSRQRANSHVTPDVMISERASRDRGPRPEVLPPSIGARTCSTRTRTVRWKVLCSPTTPLPRSARARAPWLTVGCAYRGYV